MQLRLVRNVVFPSLALLAVAGLGLACDSSSDGTAPTDDEAGVIATVRVDGAGRAGLTVRLHAPSSQTVLASGQTGSNGTTEFQGLEAGEYDVEVVLSDGFLLAEGEESRKSVTAPEGSSVGVSFDLVTDEAAAIVEIHLVSGGSPRFDPSTVTIEVGTTVRWVNDAAVFHTITPSGHSEWQRQEMNSAGQTFTHTFDAAGTFAYFCEPHQSQGMTGSITVQ